MGIHVSDRGPPRHAERVLITIYGVYNRNMVKRKVLPKKFILNTLIRMYIFKSLVGPYGHVLGADFLF
ncbi:Uu.00g051600.m01.CDS01 [Anthostomella pinea]|uniref:Uu.00g051600.m01.CDS01 n=1 Tax=Anthostomella pinea TaxID=933095 RepID=A0AAI8VWQ1_9PEZI|nr:Uu.00g051600.m01.CDS01 [Anthostomella pinea]